MPDFAASYRNLMTRAMRAGGPLTTFFAVICDLGAPLGSFVFYFALAAAVVTVVSGALWFGRYQRAMRQALADGRITPQEAEAATESNVWSVSFAFGLVATIVLSLVLAAQTLAKPNTGVVATAIPSLQPLQDSLFRVEQDVAHVRQTTDAIADATRDVKTDTAALREQAATAIAKIDDLSAAFENASKSGTLVVNPTTPADHYHNARLYELKADYAGARQSYNAYLASGVEFIDPYLAYLDMLKVQDGLAGAREVVAAMRKTNRTTSLETAAALLLERDPRLAALRQIAETHPEFAPAVYLLSREFSAEKLGEQSIADQREEKTLLAHFKDMDAKGQFQRWLLDKHEAKRWLDDADARAAKLAAIPASVLDNPVSISAMQSNAGWTLTITIADSRVKDIEYRIDGVGDFVSTGTLPMNDPRTGMPMASPSVALGKVTPGTHAVEVRYVDLTGKLTGPFSLRFDTETAGVAFGKMALEQTSGAWVAVQKNGGKSLVYFTQLLSFRSALKEIRYSFDDESLDRRFPFKPVEPGKSPYEVGDGPLYLDAPKGLQFVAVQLLYADGTTSAVKKFTP